MRRRTSSRAEREQQYRRKNFNVMCVLHDQQRDKRTGDKPHISAYAKRVGI